MSLDITITATRPKIVFEANITHNLNTMASKVKVANGLTLYQILWRPEEHGYTKTSEIAPLLLEGLNILRVERDNLCKFNPSNGWGSYVDLVEFVQQYYTSCIENPDGIVEASR